MRGRPIGAKNATVKDLLLLISKSDKQKIVLVLFVQIMLGLLDLVGVALIGLLGAISIRGVQSLPAGNKTTAILSHFNFEAFSIQKQVSYLGVFALVLFTTKTIMSLLLTRQTIFYLSRRSASISSNLASLLLRSNILVVQSRTTQENIFSLTSGVSNLTVGAVTGLVNMISDSSLLVILACGLLFVDPFIAFSIFIIFTLVAFVLYYLLYKRASEQGKIYSEISIESSELLNESIGNFRELVVKNLRLHYIKKFSKARNLLANVEAEMRFFPSISKYVIEITMIASFLLIGFIQFSRFNAAHAIAVLSVFIAATTRIAPAILRIQQGSIQLRSSLSAAGPTIDLFKYLNTETLDENFTDAIEFEHPDFTPRVSVNSVNFQYTKNSNFTIQDLSLEILPFEHIAFVGASGSGKSTIVDLILGVLQPHSGSILISDESPIEVVRNHPGAIGYVPQDVFLFAKSLKENICMGIDEQFINENSIWSVLKKVNLDVFVRSLSDGIYTNIGDRGNKLSGGQRQRLGIARALITNPKLLVLDEATSSLDGKNEEQIVNSINYLKKSITVITIAHRLSTVINADRIYYVDSGKIKASGNFEQLKKEVPEFEKQAGLIGL